MWTGSDLQKQVIGCFASWLCELLMLLLLTPALYETTDVTTTNRQLHVSNKTQDLIFMMVEIKTGLLCFRLQQQRREREMRRQQEREQRRREQEEKRRIEEMERRRKEEEERRRAEEEKRRADREQVRPDAGGGVAWCSHLCCGSENLSEIHVISVVFLLFSHLHVQVWHISKVLFYPTFSHEIQSTCWDYFCVSLPFTVVVRQKSLVLGNLSLRSDCSDSDFHLTSAEKHFKGKMFQERNKLDFALILSTSGCCPVFPDSLIFNLH